MGQESLQITGAIEEVSAEKFSEDDVKTVVSQASVSEDEARAALEAANGDLAQAILELQK